MFQVQCAFCNKQIIRRGSGQGKRVFCSRACKGKWSSIYATGDNSPHWRGGGIEVSCEQCQRKLQRTQSQIAQNKNGRHFCSRECQGLWRSANYRGEQNPQTKRIKVKCSTCNKDIIRHPHSLKRNKNHFCGRDCHIKWQKHNLPKGKQSKKYKSVQIPCSYCNEPIERPPCRTKAAVNQFCNRRCWTAYQKSGKLKKARVSVQCANCGLFMEKSPSQANNSRVRNHFCSRKCMGAWRSKTGYRPQTKKKAILVNCSYCQSELEKTPLAIAQHKNVFCNKECYSAWQSKNMRGENNPMYNRIDSICDNCGTPLSIVPFMAENYNKHFCDTKCMGEWQSKHKIGQNHPLWKGGWEEYYGPNWNQQRRAARQRDNCKCQGCRVSEKKLGRELDVHHIIPFREFGYIVGENDNYLEANALSNLISLCSSCHKRAEHGKIPIQPRLF